MMRYTDDDRMPVCPVCGEEAETLYRNRFGEIVGCDECIDTILAYDWEEMQSDY